MSHSLLEGVAATTRHRDREDLDRSLMEFLREFLNPDCITLVRLKSVGRVKSIERRLVLSRDTQPEAPCSASSLRQQEACEPLQQDPWELDQDAAEQGSLVDLPRWRDCLARGEPMCCLTREGASATIFPIRGGRDVVGLLAIRTATALSSRDADLVQGILEIIRNHVALLDYGELDTLTGLLNRKTFEHHFEKMRCRRAAARSSSKRAAPSEPDWLALIDIDHFKGINDGFGHLFGDEVLLLVSRLMKQSFRGSDQLFRFGGEEFVVALEHTPEPGARIALERLRRAIAEYAFPQVRQVTISVGYTRIRADEVPAQCLERADAALYYAKSSGRNSVQEYEGLVKEGRLAEKTQDGGDAELF